MVILERLLDAGTDANAHSDDGSTALDPARSYDCGNSIVERLLEAGAVRGSNCFYDKYYSN